MIEQVQMSGGISKVVVKEGFNFSGDMSRNGINIPVHASYMNSYLC